MPINSPATTTYAIDNSQDWNVVAQTLCRRIVVEEDYNSQTPPTVDLLQKQPAGGSAVNIAKGTPAVYTQLLPLVFNGCFQPGDVVGTIRVLSTGGVTSCTVKQIESNQV